MAYGSETNVTLLIGGADTEFFTSGSSGNIVAAIVISDVLVDGINSGATTAKKGVASELIAAEILKKGRITNKLKGLSSDGGQQGRPARAAAYRDYIPLEAYIMLTGKKKRPSFRLSTPSDDGSW